MEYTVGGRGLIALLETKAEMPAANVNVNGSAFPTVKKYVHDLAGKVGWDLTVAGWSEHYGKFNLNVATTDLAVASQLKIPKEL